MSKQAAALVERYRPVFEAAAKLCEALGDGYEIDWALDPDEHVYADLYLSTPHDGKEGFAAAMAFYADVRGIQFGPSKGEAPCVGVQPEEVGAHILKFFRHELSNLLNNYSRGVAALDDLIVAARQK